MTHTAKRSPAGEGLPAGAARLGRAALQNLLLELQGALVDVEGVRLGAWHPGALVPVATVVCERLRRSACLSSRPPFCRIHARTAHSAAICTTLPQRTPAPELRETAVHPGGQARGAG